MERSTRSRNGFTLAELLIVVTVIAIISGMAFMVVGGATDKAAATTSMATQKQLTNQINSFIQLHNGLMADGFDSLVQTEYETYGGTFSALSDDISVADDASLFMGCDTTAGTGGTHTINRGVHPSCFSGEFRTLTVKKMTGDYSGSGVDALDDTILKQLGLTLLYDYKPTDLSYGRLMSTGRDIEADGPICIIDPQSVAGQQLYKDFGVDLSDETVYERNSSDDASTSWDETEELSADGRLAALETQIFYVVGLGKDCTMIGDRQVGLQEAPASSVVPGGYYNRYMVVIKGYASNKERSTSFAGVLDPKGRGPSGAREAVNSIN